MILVLNCLVAGSSPLTRGKLETPHQGLAARGLIPTHAGNTSGRSFRPSSGGAPPRSRRETRISVTRRRIIRAHPRSRRKNGNKTATAKQPHGSSPLTRGKPDWRRVRRVYDRLIPTHAGKTTSSSSAFSLTRAHPRSRGENASADSESTVCVGSSPLTRGKHAVAPCVEADLRLIPTHAGKTSRSN